MDLDKNKRIAALSWIFVVVLVSLSATLGVLQYRWIGEVSRAERERLRGSLEASLHRLSQDFNAEIAGACAALMPASLLPGERQQEEAYALHYEQWKESSRHNRLFRRIALAVPQGNSVRLRSLDLASATFGPADWPDTWKAFRDRLTARLSGDPAGPRGPFGGWNEEEAALIELPRLSRPEGPGPPAFRERREPRERVDLQWMILELDLDYMRTVILPELLQRHLGGTSEYQAEIEARGNPSVPIYRSDGDRAFRIGNQADASVFLFDVQYDQIFRRAGVFRSREGWRGGGRGRAAPPQMQGPDRGRWRLAVRHRSGSLEAVVNRARWRNLAVTTAVLVLMLVAIAALVRFTRRSQRLAELQMEFVAGVSHELRTPLSVIRTAAHNLGRGVVSDARQVQRYGTLIKDEADRLTSIVEQVLRFATAKAGRPIGAREPVSVQSLIEDAAAATAGVLEESRCTIEKRISPGLPPVLADSIALKHALQNLLTNAAKYGTEGGWIGITASMPADRQDSVEIRVSDRGPGIPADELGQIFDPFYRGRRALENQIHGTGLGLNLVKRIVEAHGGTVSVESQPGEGTEFVLRIPSASAEQEHEYADSSHRG